MRRVLPFFVLIVLCASLLSCGGQDLELVAVEISPSSPNVVGIGGSQQMTVIARYNDQRTEDVTEKSTFMIEPPMFPVDYSPDGALTINASGMVQVVDGACTWENSGTTEEPKYGTTPYKLTAKYQNFTAVAFISVGAHTGCQFPGWDKDN